MIVVVLAVAVGPAEVVQPGWLGDASPEPPRVDVTQPPPAEQSSAPIQEDAADEAPPLSIPWQAVLVVALTAAAALAYYLMRRLPAFTFRGTRRSVTGGHVEALPDVADDLRDAAVAADAAMAGGGAAGAEAVIEAWLGLESAAAGSGVSRDPAQTPSEFTAALLRRHHADDAATSALLALYHRARFAARPDITPDDVDTARQALREIVSTLRTPVPS